MFYSLMCFELYFNMYVYVCKYRLRVLIVFKLHMTMICYHKNYRPLTARSSSPRNLSVLNKRTASSYPKVCHMGKKSHYNFWFGLSVPPYKVLYTMIFKLLHCFYFQTLKSWLRKLQNKINKSKTQREIWTQNWSWYSLTIPGDPG